LDKSAIYRKTARGVAEITAKDRTVDRRLRPLLILIDGDRTALQVHSLVSGIGIREEDFDQLSSGGFIEPLARPSREIDPEPWAPESSPNPASPTESPEPRGPRSSFERFCDGQRYLCETATERLGLKSFFFVLKLEKCSSAEDLMGLLPEFEAAIARKLDGDYARQCRRIAETILQR
jgi:hypothetical protein